MSFPKWKYHETEPAVIVNTPEEEEALGEGWAETPAAFEAKSEPESEAAEKKPKRGKAAKE